MVRFSKIFLLVYCTNWVPWYVWKSVNMSQVWGKKPCVASFEVEKKFEIFSFHLQNEILEGRKIRISLLIFLYPPKKVFFFFDFQNVTVSLWVKLGSMISIRESKKSSSMRKDTLCGKFLFWQKKFEIFCLQSQNWHNTFTLQKSFKKWKSNQNEKWLDLTVHHSEGVQMKMKTYLEYHFGFFRLLPERLKLFLEKIFSSKCHVFTNT